MAGSQLPVAVSLHQLLARKMTLLRPSLVARGVSSVEVLTVMSR